EYNPRKDEKEEKTWQLFIDKFIRWLSLKFSFYQSQIFGWVEYTKSYNI
ncbi:MAG: hypothetical protein JWQ14_3566, partial [Adhaeribacter sp.]|nr:hypothetical protein [Adhaeribacter sp.]